MSIRSARGFPQAVLVALIAVLAGCGSPTAPQDAAQSPTPSPAGGKASAAPTEDAGPVAAAEGAAVSCEPVEEPPLQAGSHLIGDTEPPVPYSSTPPTSGWHTSGAFEVTIHGPDDQLSEAAQVSVLEADGVVVTYRDLPAEDVAALEELVRERYDGRIAVTPYDALEPGQVALTAWGTLQRCSGLDLDAITAFAEDHLGDDVTPGHSH